LGEEFQYPVTSNPEITSSIVRLEPGAETGWHLHEAPMYAYILEGTLEVTYEVAGSMMTKVYNEGEAIMEGLDTRHNGKNTSDRPVSVLVVNMGSPGLENTVKL
jgi:quercetin dioxygenase-like cupin family protein